jgi:hypothetical protein
MCALYALLRGLLQDNLPRAALCILDYTNYTAKRRPSATSSAPRGIDEYNPRDGKFHGDALDPMPTLLFAEGFRFYFFSLENGDPPHVHIRKGSGKAKFRLSPVSLSKSRGLTQAELRRAHELTREHADEFPERWRGYFDRH